MSGRREKSEQEKHYENELKQKFAERFKTACQKKFNKNKNDEIGTKELFEIFKHVYPERALLYLDDKNSAVPTLRKWLNGGSIPEYSALIKLCDKECLNCSIDYLFGRIECTKHDIQFIHDETGLSENAIKQLHFLHHSSSPELRNNVVSLSHLLEYFPFSGSLLQDITRFLFKYWQYRDGKKIYEKEKKKQVSKDILQEIKLRESGYEPLMTDKKLAELTEGKDVALFHVTTNFSSVLTKIAENLYKESQEEKAPNTN